MERCLAVVAWSIAFLMGWLAKSWRDGIVLLPIIAALLTGLCFITTNSPVLTAAERHLTFTVGSIALNFGLKLVVLSGCYLLGHVLKTGAEHFSVRRLR